jgi:MoxR-like ATPase
MMQPDSTNWFVYGHSDATQRTIQRVFNAGTPPWRDFGNPERRTDYEFQIDDFEKQVVNAALYLRRPLLVIGEPGTGKSSLAYSIAKQLDLGKVLVWPITSRSTLEDALYRYDAIGRLQAANLIRRTDERAEPPRIEYFMTLGPLGTALADSKEKPRVLLIDEIDKSDIDLPNDLLYIFEEGEFEIPELVRLIYVEKHGQDLAEELSGKSEDVRYVRKFDGVSMDDTVAVLNGRVRCNHFPVVILTSNRERELPAPFLRRCLPLNIKRPDQERLEQIVVTHFGEKVNRNTEHWDKVAAFIKYITDQQNAKDYISPDQLMNAVHLVLSNVPLETTITRGDEKTLAKTVLNVISKLRM